MKLIFFDAFGRLVAEVTIQPTLAAEQTPIPRGAVTYSIMRPR